MTDSLSDLAPTLQFHLNYRRIWGDLTKGKMGYQQRSCETLLKGSILSPLESKPAHKLPASPMYAVILRTILACNMHIACDVNPSGAVLCAAKRLRIEGDDLAWVSEDIQLFLRWDEPPLFDRDLQNVDPQSTQLQRES